MTRRVRSGSSQKHKKMPGDATKWGEFDNQYKAEIPPKKKKIKHEKSNSSPSNPLPSETLSPLKMDLINEDELSLSHQAENVNENGEIKDESISSYKNIKADSTFSITNPKTKNKMKKQRYFDMKFSKAEEFETQKHKKIKSENVCSEIKLNNESFLSITQNDNHESFSQTNDSTAEPFSHQHKKKKKSKKAKQSDCDIDSETLMIDISSGTSLPDHHSEISIKEEDNKCFNSSNKACDSDKSSPQDNGESSKTEMMKNPGEINSDLDHSLIKNEKPKKFLSKAREIRKQQYLEQLKKKREDLGLLDIPRSAETKLYKIKKRLKEKGFPPEMQKEIMRKARRREELKFRKIFNPSKVCFNCRDPGHILADCPKKSESLKQETGICFKCGSVEHVSYKCPEKVQGFPFAKCFICKEQGHISRDCVKNRRGIYPRGGQCKLCGNVNHLKKDCPTLKKEEVEEENFTLPTLNEGASIDSEVMPKEETVKKTEKKAKNKIVKF